MTDTMKSWLEFEKRCEDLALLRCLIRPSLILFVTLVTEVSLMSREPNLSFEHMSSSLSAPLDTVSQSVSDLSFVFLRSLGNLGQATFVSNLRFGFPRVKRHLSYEGVSASCRIQKGKFLPSSYSANQSQKTVLTEDYLDSLY